LLFVGRLINEKGIFELLDAMSIILKQLDCRLQIAGDGEQRAAILDRIRSANLTKSISLLGYLDGGQLSQAYQRASALVLPSYREGFPSSITEAMSFGLPIVTTAVGGIPDHLLPEVNALYIPIGDPEAIARAVLRLAADPILCERMGRANLAKIRDFAPEQVAPQYLAVFRDLLALNLAGGAS
jgi:glycosyltransferase involved in cell wall biosynthesis